MRLIKLKIKNIASLRGEHLIDFEKIQFESSLFAITGETGAGKSSILNSIGLVLYGKVYKTSINQNDLVTLGEKDGSIELIFQAAGKLYFANWKVRTRKHNGEYYSTPQVPTRELYQIESVNFEAKKTILSKKAEDILQLDFDQFCKCIILNQGEFARFLTASFSDRKDILEKLYPGELIDRLSYIIKKEKDEVEKDIRELDIELHTLKGPDEEGPRLRTNIKNLQNEIESADAWNEVLEKLSFEFISLINYQKKFTENTTRIDQLKLSLSKETSHFNLLQSNIEQVNEEFKKTNTLFETRRPELQSLLKEEEKLSLIKKEIFNIEKELNKLNLELDNLKEQKTNESLKKETAYNDLIKLKQALHFSFEDLRGTDLIEIFELWNNLEKTKQELTSFRKELDQKLIAQENIKQKLESLSQESGRLQMIAKRVLTLKDEETKWQFKLNENLRITQVIEDLKKKRKANQAIIMQLMEDISTKKIEYSNSQKLYIDIQKDLSISKLLSAIEVCLSHPSTIETETCPICKSSISAAEIERIKSETGIKDQTNLIEQEKELSLRLSILRNDLMDSEKQRKKIETDVQDEEKLIAQNNLLLHGGIPNIEDLRVEIDKAQKMLWGAEKATGEMTELKKDLSLLVEDIKKKESFLEELKSSFSKLILKMDELKTTFTFITEFNETTIQFLKQDEKTARKIIESEFLIEKAQQSFLFSEKNIKKNEDSITATQENLRKLLDSKIEIEGRLKSSLGSQSATAIIDELSNEVKLKSAQLASKEKELKDQELKIKELQSRLYTIEEIIRDIDLLYTKSLHTTKTIAESNRLVATADLQFFMQKMIHLDLKLNDPEELFISILDLLNYHRDQNKNDSTELKMQFASCRTRLEEWDRKQDKIKTLEFKILELEKKHQRRSRLFEVLGKDELRTFVLSIVEENLILQTNEELQKLCLGRYEIIHYSRTNKTAPEFFIMDKFRDGGIRKISTLSGGETFMVSLAMAIALAEMTRGKAEIDSLFIDEGFGTLDSDSLQDVLDVLKQIQNRGLMIGIISHVKELTSSIPINLNVVKGQDGNSSLRVIFN